MRAPTQLILTVKMATHTVARMKPLEDRNSNNQGFLGAFCSARSARSVSSAILQGFDNSRDEQVRKPAIEFHRKTVAKAFVTEGEA